MRLNVARVALPRLHHELKHAVAEGRGPDLAVVDSVWVAELSAAGFLWPLDELDAEWASREYQRDFLEPFVSANRHAGRPIAVQAEADVAGLWYSRRDLEALGLEPPETWEDLVAVARTLKAARDPGFHPLALPGGSRGGETTTYGLLALLAANGARVLDDDGVTLDTPGAAEALAFLLRLEEEGLVRGEAVAYERDRPIRLLAHGHAAMCVGGSYDGPALAAEAGRTLHDVWDQFGFAAIPVGPHGARGDAGRRHGVRDPAPGRPAGRRDAAARAADVDGGVCAHVPGDGPAPAAAVRGRHRRGRVAVPGGHRRDALLRGGAPEHPDLPAGFGAAPGHARGGTDAAAGAGCRRRARRGHDRRRDGAAGQAPACPRSARWQRGRAAHHGQHSLPGRRPRSGYARDTQLGLGSSTVNTPVADSGSMRDSNSDVGS